jgi:glyoxylase-like metal-dependent hydrolase (beta-lactamase superfamily II)
VKIGSIEVTPLVDAEGSFATMSQAFPALRSDEPWWLPMNVALVRGEGLVLLVDTGLGPAPRSFMPDTEVHLPELLADAGIEPDAGVEPDAVDLVVHTHLHVDHVGWDGAFPNARYVVHEQDWAFFMTEESIAERPHLREKVLPLQDDGRVEVVAGETEVAPGVRVVPTPGHTPGHVSVRVESEGDALVVLGDVVVHMVQVADPTVQYVNDTEHELATATRRQVLAQLADEAVPVIAGHFQGSGRFVRQRDGFGWEPAKNGAAPVE